MIAICKHLLLLLTAITTVPLSIVAKPAPYQLSHENLAAYEKDGVIVVRGLLKGKELKDATKAANSLQRSKSLSQRLFYRAIPIYRNLEFQTWRRYRALETVAFDSAAPTICAKLMGLDDDDKSKNKNKNPRPLRLLRDAVLGFSPGDKGCGWHVDDKMFWPCEDRNIGKRDAGINVWITLSPISASEGGGLAVAPGTNKLKLKFAEKARKAIKSLTCELATLAPDCHEEMEKLTTVYDLEPGDAIIHDRYIFHKAHPFAESESHANKNKKQKRGTKQRISLRYVPADATFYNNGMKNDPGVALKNLETGDAVSKGGEYYPQVWPNSLPDERSCKAKNESRGYMTLQRALSIFLSKKMQKNS